MNAGHDDESPIDTSRPHPARRYNHWLGGKDHFRTDRESSDAIQHAYPYIRSAAMHNRAFHHRVIHYLAKDAGVTQFIDIGTGIPTSDGNDTHEIAQRINPAARVVYVDNDPLVMTHARALLTSAPPGRCGYAHADLCDPDTILAHPDVTTTIDFRQPVAILLFAVLHFLRDSDDPESAVRTLTEAVAPGSYLAISHATDAHLDQDTVRRIAAATEDEPFTLRSLDRITGFFTGCDLVTPGITVLTDWPEQNQDVPAYQVAMFGGVGRTRGDSAG